MSGKAILVAALLAAVSGPGAMRSAGNGTAAGCIDVADPGARVVAEGRLNEVTFEDPYGTERAFILELPQAVCIDDGGQFADPAGRFSRVHVGAADDDVLRDLRRAVGRNVSVRGEGFAAHSRHHHAPLVVIASEVRVR